MRGVWWGTWGYLSLDPTKPHSFIVRRHMNSVFPRRLIVCLSIDDCLALKTSRQLSVSWILIWCFTQVSPIEEDQGSPELLLWWIYFKWSLIWLCNGKTRRFCRKWSLSLIAKKGLKCWNMTTIIKIFCVFFNKKTLT